MQLDAERSFLSNVFKVGLGGQNKNISTNLVNGLGINFDIIRRTDARLQRLQLLEQAVRILCLAKTQIG